MVFYNYILLMACKDYSIFWYKCYPCVCTSNLCILPCILDSFAPAFQRDVPQVWLWHIQFVCPYIWSIFAKISFSKSSLVSSVSFSLCFLLGDGDKRLLMPCATILSSEFEVDGFSLLCSVGLTIIR